MCIIKSYLDKIFLHARCIKCDMIRRGWRSRYLRVIDTASINYVVDDITTKKNLDASGSC